MQGLGSTTRRADAPATLRYNPFRKVTSRPKNQPSRTLQQRELSEEHAQFTYVFVPGETPMPPKTRASSLTSTRKVSITHFIGNNVDIEQIRNGDFGNGMWAKLQDNEKPEDLNLSPERDFYQFPQIDFTHRIAGRRQDIDESFRLNGVNPDPNAIVLTINNYWDPTMLQYIQYELERVRLRREQTVKKPARDHFNMEQLKAMLTDEAGYSLSIVTDKKKPSGKSPNRAVERSRTLKNRFQEILTNNEAAVQNPNLLKPKVLNVSKYGKPKGRVTELDATKANERLHTSSAKQRLYMGHYQDNDILLKAPLVSDNAQTYRKALEDLGYTPADIEAYVQDFERQVREANLTSPAGPAGAGVEMSRKPVRISPQKGNRGVQGQMGPIRAETPQQVGGGSPVGEYGRSPSPSGSPTNMPTGSPPRAR